MILQLRMSATKQKYDYTKQNKAEKMASEKGLTKHEGKNHSTGWFITLSKDSRYIETEPEMSMPWQSFPGNKTQELSPKCNELNQRLSKVT